MKPRIVSGLPFLVLCLALPKVVAVETSIDPALLNRRASTMAPAGVYRRNLGFISAELPVGGSQAVEVAGRTYYYDRGTFWVDRGGRFIVVAAPAGAVVEALPSGAEKLPGRTDALFYWFGTFFAEKSGKFEVVAPPVGAVVGYLPEGYRQVLSGGSTAYMYDTTCYRPVVDLGTLMYQVSDCAVQESKVEAPVVAEAIVRSGPSQRTSREKSDGTMTIDKDASLFPAKKRDADGRKKKNPVTFNHEDHGKKYRCKECHHTGDEEESCFSCHGPEAQGKQIDSYEMIHGKAGLCVNCHKTDAKAQSYKAPTACKDCHGGVE